MLELQTSAILKDTQDIIKKSMKMNSGIKELTKTIMKKKKESFNQYQKVSAGIDTSTVVPKYNSAR